MEYSLKEVFPLKIKETDLQLNNDEAFLLINQISYAQKNKRDVKKVIIDSINIATSNYEMAESCIYSILAKNKHNETKMISGKSVNLARILSQNWGNLRVSQRKIQQTEYFITVECAAIDLENNLGLQLQLDYQLPNQYSKDLLRIYEQIAHAILFRNTILSIIPKNISDEVYNAAINYIKQYIKNQNLEDFRQNIYEKIIEKYNVPENVILKIFNIKSIYEIDDTKIIDFIGLLNSLNDGNIIADEIIENSKITNLEQIKKEKINRLS